MIQSSLQPGGFQKWSDVPLSKQNEVLADKAVLTFSASTSTSEKMGRIFNDAMFSIVALRALVSISSLIGATSAISNWSFTTLNIAALTQFPIVVKISLIAPQIILTVALVIVIRKILAVAITHIVYPATIMSYMNKQEINSDRWESFNELNNQKFECRRVALNKSGMNYDAFVIEHETTKDNDQWVVIAGGNGWIGESAILTCVKQFKNLGFNILFVNGPGVGSSSKFPTTYGIGAAQEAGLQFLEKVVKAKKILLYGTSLGGGAQAEAIQSHTFRKNIKYMVWSDRSFDTLSHAASEMVLYIAKPIFFLLGIQLNGIAGAKKLQKLGIKHIVTQRCDTNYPNSILPNNGPISEHGTDGVIPNKASLYVGLRKAGIQDSPRMKFYGNPWVGHNGPLPAQVNVHVWQDIREFLSDNNPVT